MVGRRCNVVDFVLGVDIAKRKFDVALLVNGKVKHKVFPNDEQGFSELSMWLKKYNVEHVHACMEASSTYGEELGTYLYDMGYTVSIVNPARIKGFAQSELLRLKNDKVDAGVIARFCDRMHPAPWKPLPPEVRRLQALVRRVDALMVMRTQELNRIGSTHETVLHCGTQERDCGPHQERAEPQGKIGPSTVNTRNRAGYHRRHSFRARPIRKPRSCAEESGIHRSCAEGVYFRQLD
jgi:transposase